MRADPIKLAFQAPGTKLLKLNHDGPLSNFAFNFNLRRYSEENMFIFGALADQEGRCRLTVSKSKLKAPLASSPETKMC